MAIFYVGYDTAGKYDYQRNGKAESDPYSKVNSGQAVLVKLHFKVQG